MYDRISESNIYVNQTNNSIWLQISDYITIDMLQFDSLMTCITLHRTVLSKDIHLNTYLFVL